MSLPRLIIGLPAFFTFLSSIESSNADTGRGEVIAISVFVQFMYPLFYCSMYKGIYRTLYALCEIQRFCYQHERGRCPRDILRCHLMAAILAIGFYSLFSKRFQNTKPRMFGMPLHAVITHIPQTYRLVSLQSLESDFPHRLIEWIGYDDSFGCIAVNSAVISCQQISSIIHNDAAQSHSCSILLHTHSEIGRASCRERV